jgi:FAD dependent oxidoreductase
MARASSNLLAVGHIYRFSPVVAALRNVTAERADRPNVIFGTLINPIGQARDGDEPSLEMLHWFDVIDWLFGYEPISSSTVRQGRMDVVSLRYPGPMNAVLKLGWEGEQKQRTLELIYNDQSLQVDLVDQTLTIDRGTNMRRINFPHDHSPLESEFRGFVSAIRRRRPRDADATTVAASTGDATTVDPTTVDAAVGARIAGVAVRAMPRRPESRPRVAVIGAGIFGATCAAELGQSCDVSLIERHDALLREASTLNQWRYHHGFHYPRSVEMIREIQECRHEFEAVYGGAIVPDVSSYYCVAKTARIITPERYRHVCESMSLQFELTAPPERIIDASRVSLCMRTQEGVFDAGILSQIVNDRLNAVPTVALHLNHEVLGGDLLADGRKRLMLRRGQKTFEETFDYVVNATYQNRNLLARIFGFPLKPLRFDLLELLELEIDLPRISLTVLDGPFTSLVSTGEDRRFTLSHIQQSVLASATPADGFPPAWGEPSSNRENLIRHASRYMPVLETARYVDSRYGTRTVHALPEDVDGRPTVVVSHGFGCWSILGGKVNTSVTNARQIAEQIAMHQRFGTAASGAQTATADDAEEWRDRSPIGAQRR